jgi:predicted transcriptional regulator
MHPMNEDFTINKLIVLYLLAEIKIPLSLSQMTQIVLERGYADYFSMQQYLNELVESELIIKNKENHSSYFTISDKGLQTLEFFSSRIPSTTLNELNHFIASNWRKLRTELDIFAEYTPHKENEYIVHCKVLENESTLIEVKVNVGSKKQAIAMCAHWKQNATSLYSEILTTLSKT